MISAPSPITLSLLSTQPLVRIFIPITPLCTSPSVPKYLFPKPFPTPSPSQPSVLHPTYSQPHSDSQEPVLPSRVPLLSCSSSSLAPQALASCGPLRPPLPPDTPFPLISPFPDVPLGGTPLFCPFLFPTPGVARPPSLPASLSLPLCPSHSCARCLRPRPLPLSSTPAPPLCCLPPVTSEPPPSPTSPSSSPRSVGQSVRRVCGFWLWRWLELWWGLQEANRPCFPEALIPSALQNQGWRPLLDIPSAALPRTSVLPELPSPQAATSRSPPWVRGPLLSGWGGHYHSWR